MPNSGNIGTFQAISKQPGWGRGWNKINKYIEINIVKDGDLFKEIHV